MSTESENIQFKIMQTITELTELRRSFSETSREAAILDAQIAKLAEEFTVISANPSRGISNSLLLEVDAFKKISKEMDAYIAKLRNLVSMRNQTDEQLEARARRKFNVPMGVRPTGGSSERQDVKDAVDEMNAAQEKIYAERHQAAIKAEQQRARAKAQSLLGSLSESVAGGEATVERINAKLRQYSMSPESLSNIFIRGSSGVTDLKYKMRDDSGAFRTAEFTVSKYGEVIEKTNRRLLSFGDAVGKNTLEFMKWSLAVTLVLVPLRKLSEVAGQVVEQQDKLVNTMIALGNSQKDVNQVYAEAYEVSKNVSEEIGNVIDAFTLAYRATGNVANEEERFTISSKLLTDALTLSKLAGIDEATAIDTLTASLKQMDMSLSEGTTLLDEWVRATQIANVDLNSLATSFAVVGDAGTKVGMTTEELIGLISTLGETGIASGRELANMTKAVVGGFQSDQAQRLLRSYGVSLENVSGEAKTFEEIMTQIAGMQKQGIFGTEQYNQLTLILGGGTRRQAVWSTLIENWSRVNEVASGVQNSQGTAAEALAKKQETVVSATTRLNNALMNMGTTLGNKGGLLESFSTLLNILTGIVDAFNMLFSVVGRVSPMLLAIGGYSIFKSFQSPMWQAMMAGKYTNFLSGTLGRLAYGNTRMGPSQSALFDEGVLMRDLWAKNLSEQKMAQSGLLSNFSKRTGVNAGFSALMVGSTALANLTDKTTDKYTRQARGMADIVGGVAGGIAGSFAGNPILGATIGMSISEGFVNATVAKETEFENFFKKVVPIEGKGETTTTEEKSIDEQITDAMQKAKQESGGGKALFGSLLAGFQTRDSLINTLMFGTGAIAPGKYEHEEQYYYENASPETKALLDSLRKQKSPTQVFETDEFLVLEKSVQDKYSAFLKGLEKSAARTLLEQLGSGELTQSAYKTALAASKNYNLSVAGTYAVVGEEYGAKTGKSAEQTLKEFARVYTYASEEQQNAVSILVDNINQYKKSLGNMTAGSDEYNTTQTLLNEAVSAAITLFGELNGQIAQQIKLNSISNFPEYTLSTINKVAKSGTVQQKELEKFIASGGKMEDWEAYKSQFPGFVPQVAGGGYGQLIGKGQFSVETFNDVLQQLLGTGEISKVPSANDLIFKNLSATPEQLEEVFSVYETFVKQLQEKLGYQLEEEMAIISTEGGKPAVYTKDWKIVEFLLAQILDTEEKQLETSIYNFPEGTQAYVPFSGYNKGFGNTGGGYNAGTLSDILNLLTSMPKKEETPTTTIPTEPIVDGLVQPREYTVVPKEISPIVKPRRYGGFFDLNAGEPEEKAATTSLLNQEQSLLNDLQSGLLELFNLSNPTFQPEKYPLTPLTYDNAKPLQTKLTMDIKNNLVVNLDGRIIATVVSRYLGSSIERSSVGGSTTSRYNII